MDNKELADAITAAIKEGFSNVNTGASRAKPDISPPPAENESTPRIEINTADVAKAESKLAELDGKTDGMYSKFKKMSGGVTGITGGVFKGVSQSAIIMADAFADLNDELDSEIDYFRQIQNNFGGVSDAAYMAGEEVTGLAGQALDAQQHLAMVGSAGKDSMLEIKSGALAGKNPLIALFKDPLEPAKMFSEVMVNVAADNVTLAKSLESQGKAEMERIAVIRKRMGVDSDTMGDILRRQYAFTGEASSKIFEDIASVAVNLAKTTGGSAKDLKDDILDIMKDTNLFGDIGVDAAGRISASLNTLGLDFQTFKSMTNQFMNFDSAAEKMGDMSALFGIQMDAMEMTYLANEDQEEFLLRMREEVLDAGLDVENMSKTRQRALTDQLGLQSIEQMQQFMDTGIQIDQDALMASTDAAKDADGMQSAIEDFGGAFEGASRGAAEFEESLRNQARYTDDIARDILTVRKESEASVSAIQDFRLSDAAKENARVLLNADLSMMQGFNKKILPVMKDTAQAAADITAEMVNKVATTVGGGSMTRVTVATGDLGTSVANLKDATNKEAENIAKRSENIDKNIENQSALQGDVTSLIDTLKQNKEMKVNLTLDSGKLSDKLFAIQEEKNGGNITFVTEK
mgnify:CR=1 FL=1|tara:strand:- start:2631 stop:4529 length:1899 start_codon:yes stop_codon:yes gene_type:complete